MSSDALTRHVRRILTRFQQHDDFTLCGRLVILLGMRDGFAKVHEGLINGGVALEREMPHRRVLLVEDHPNDAQLIREILTVHDGDFDFRVVTRLSEAMEALRRESFHIILLDLTLPDCPGVEAVRWIRKAAGQTPIVALTSAEVEPEALSCLAEGAEEIVNKERLEPFELRRSIDRAGSSNPQDPDSGLHRVAEKDRVMSSAGQQTLTTAEIVGSGVVALRHPRLFSLLVEQYSTVLAPASSEADADRLRNTLTEIVTAVGERSGGPRDLLDIHVEALDRVSSLGNARQMVFEARLVALESMGLLVDYYRVGQRRSMSSGVQS